MKRPLSGIEQLEIDAPQILEHKDRLLGSSAFAETWMAVGQARRAPASWTPAKGDARTLFVLEHIVERIGLRQTLKLLVPLRMARPNASILLVLPSTEPIFRSRKWSALNGDALTSDEVFQVRGWKLVDDQRLTGRPEVRNRTRGLVCAGLAPLRLCRLVPLND